jgi:hypothetical protein
MIVRKDGGAALLELATAHDALTTTRPAQPATSRKDPG